MKYFIQFFIGAVLFFSTWIITVLFVKENMTLGLIVSILVIGIYILIIKNKNDRRLKLSGKYELELGEDKEEAHIKKELRKIVKRVEREDLHELISNLYYNMIRYYPELLKTDRDQIPSSVEAVNMAYEGVRKDKTAKRAIDIVLHGRRYRFIEHTDSLLELFAEEEKVLAINTKQNSLLAFKEGKWIHDFEQFKREVTLKEKESTQQGEKETHAELIRTAKKSFDID